MGDWTLFSNHGHVLVCLARNNEARLRDVATDVGITERAVQKIVRELQQAEFISITKHGRCNRYDIQNRKSLRHPLESQCTVGRLLQSLNVEEKAAKVSADKPRSRKPPADAPGPAQLPDTEIPVERPVQRAELKKESTRKVPISEDQPSPREESSKQPARKADSDKNNADEDPSDDRQQGSLF